MISYVWHPLLLAFGLLTRFPVPSVIARPGELGRAAIFFPWVGGVLGAALWGSAVLLEGLEPSSLAGVVLATLLALATGGLHLDGVADWFDGVGGGRGDRTRMLEIMRDSRIGAHGAVALVLLLLAKVHALSWAVSHGSLVLWVGFPAVARASVVPLMAFLPAARQDGLGHAFRPTGRTSSVAIVGLTLMLLVGMAASWTPLLPAAGAVLCALGMGFWARRRLGGMTGDVLGATIELCELTFLIVWIYAVGPAAGV